MTWKVLVELDERYCPYRLSQDYQMEFCGKADTKCCKENCPMNPQNMKKKKK